MNHGATDKEINLASSTSISDIQHFILKNPYCGRCQFKDRVYVNGQKNEENAWVELRPPDLVIDIDSELGVVPAHLAVEQAHLIGYKPKNIILERLDLLVSYLPVNASNMSREDLDKLPKIYYIIHKRSDLFVDIFLNDYNSFLKTIDEPSFHNLSILGDTRESISNFTTILKERGTSFYASNDGFFVPKNKLTEDAQKIVDSLDIFCLNYKAKMPEWWKEKYGKL